MARLTDPRLLGAYRNALGNWSVTNYVIWTELAQAWVRRELELTTGEVARLMHEYLCCGGEIDRVKEIRPEWSNFDFHYDLRMTIEGRRVYVETRLFYEDLNDPDDPYIHVVNIHDE